MKYQERCECCDSIVTAYTHNLNKPLVSALRQLVDFYFERRKAYVTKRMGEGSNYRMPTDGTEAMCNIARDLKLTHNQLANFQKLQYFGLVFRVGGSGKWLPTPDGIQFVHGELSILSPVATFKGKVIPTSHDAWKTHNGRQESLHIKDVDVFSYKQREEYQAEKSQQQSLI